MTKISHYIIIGLSIFILSTTLSCSKTSNDESIKTSNSQEQKDNKASGTQDTEKTRNTNQTEENNIASDADSSMQALEDIQIDVTNSEAFLAMNAKKEGVTTTASGLQYRVLTQGSGPKPSKDSVVEVHYRGTFPNGEEFDSSYKRGEPTSFGVTRVIKGWTEALLLMNEGSKYELVIPSELAYGARGAGDVIPPNQVLKFEVELLNANFK